MADVAPPTRGDGQGSVWTSSSMSRIQRLLCLECSEPWAEESLCGRGCVHRWRLYGCGLRVTVCTWVCACVGAGEEGPSGGCAQVYTPYWVRKRSLLRHQFVTMLTSEGLREWHSTGTQKWKQNSQSPSVALFLC